MDDDRSTTRLRVLEQRLARMEAGNRRFRRAALAALALSASMLLMGVAPTARVPDVLTARSFELVDESGNVRGLWSARGDVGIAMVLLDDDGKATTALRMTAADPYVALHAGDGMPLGSDSKGRRLFSWGEPQAEPEGAGEHRRWPSWGGDRSEERGEDPDFDWDLN